MNKGLQGVLIALAAAFVLMMGIAVALLGKQAFAQPAAQPAAPVGGGEEETPVNTIQVTAQGTVRVEPDIAYITLGVQSQARTAEASQAANMEKMTALYESLKQLGIAEKDYYTSQYSVNPDYTYSGNTQRITGYTTTNMIEVTMRDLNEIGTLLDAAAKAGMNQAYSLQFGLENPDAAGLEALETALKNADAKAKLMAETTGVQIVRILGVKDTVVSTSSPYGNYRYAAPEAAAYDAAAAVPVSSGTMEVTMQAGVTYEIK
ncbi:MAG TPA: SIMPL domain-containing protein [Feifaniaceae bacterium]|nr:SIMPL domain-containing protein [Feifaniaceae bacterium]